MRLLRGFCCDYKPVKGVCSLGRRASIGVGVMIFVALRVIWF